MNHNLIYNFLLSVLIGIGLVACGDSKDDPVIPSGDFTVGKTELKYSRDGGVQELNVRSSVSPQVSVDCDWITFDVARRGSTDIYTVSVTAAANHGDYDDRTAVMTIGDGTSSAQVTITQVYALGLEIVSISATEIDGDGAPIDIEVKTNGTLTVTTPAWIVPREDSRALSPQSLHYDVAPNRTGVIRSGVISIALDGTGIVKEITVSQGQAAALIGLTAQDIAARFEMGINIGNTLEAIGGETAWGAARVNDAYISSLKKAGFNFLRLPVAWYNHCNKETLEIDAAWMARVKEVVDLIVSHDLFVMMNIHWDEGWMEKNISSYDAGVDKIQRTLWTQIAANFKDYDSHLLFAGANEAGEDSQASADALRTYMQTFIDVVRASGGNNADRVLVVQAPATNFDFAVKYCKELPADMASDRLMLEVHYYDPVEFCILANDGEWGGFGYRRYFWGADYHTGTDRDCYEAEESYLDGKMEMIKSNFIDKGVPVVIGEFGATRRSGIENLEKHLASRAYYHSYLVSSAVKHGLMPVYWETPGDMFNRSSGEIIDSRNLDAMISAAKKK